MFGGFLRSLVAEVKHERFAIKVEMAIEQRSLPVVLILCADQPYRRIFRKREHQVFRALDIHAHGFPADMMRNFHGESFHVRVLLQSGYGNLENRQHHVLEGAQRAMALVHQFRGVGPEIVPGEFDYGHPAIVVEAQRTLVGALLLDQLQIKHTAEIKRIGKDVALNLRAHRLQLLKVFFLQGAHLGILDFSGGQSLTCSTSEVKPTHENSQPTLTFARKQSRELRREDRKPSECRRSTPEFRISTKYIRREPSAATCSAPARRAR